ncbi:hypothetical protein RCH22_002531 [Cryobacterium psychrotolerans]|nr:hypothetical protein [Cryobacterium psychrotolerans]
MRRSIAEAKRSAFTPKRHDFTTARQYVKKTLRDIVLSKTNVWGTIA